MVGNFKEIYGEKIVDLLPEETRLTRLFDFKFAEALGNKFHQPVDLATEHGITYAPAGVGPVTLLPPTAGQMQDAQVDGSQIYARAQVDYETMMKASQEGKKAFAKATSLVVHRLTKSAAKRLEVDHLHGRRGWGAIASVSGTGTTRTWVIDPAAWAAGLWAGTKGMTLDVWAANYSAKINTNLAVTLTNVDVDNRALSVSGNATDLTAVVAGMHLFPETSSPVNSFAGIDAIIRNTGTLFNIDASQFELWKGRTVSSVGRPQMSVLLQGVRRCVEMGLKGEMVAIVPPRAFEILNEDAAALRRTDGSYRPNKFENGVEEIEYHGQNGVLRIMPHLYQKEGQIHIVATKEWRRIGASDMGFITRTGTGEDKLLLELPNSTASEMRCGFHGALFCEAPAHAVVLDGITYT